MMSSIKTARFVASFLLCSTLLSNVLCLDIRYVQAIQEKQEPRDPVIDTKSGMVRGLSYQGNTLLTFYGIPYAEPPLNHLRFKPPVPISRWSHVLNATSQYPPCYQAATRDMDKTMFPPPWSEDCLKLNIWAPKTSNQSLPVLVYIHGGGFIMGSAVGFTDGLSIATESNIVVVSMSYRLGVFGYLSLGNSHVPGNMGLMDQRLAISWVKDNIVSFGGDPNSMTIMGFSSGAASAGYQLISPLNKGFFKRAILMSGSPTNIWAFDEPERAVQRGLKFLSDVGCSMDNVTLREDCLQGKTSDDILEASREPSLYSNEHFLPTIDGRLITEHPKSALLGRRFNNVDLLMGSVADEGLQYVQYRNPDMKTDGEEGITRAQFQTILGRYLSKFNKGQSKVVEVFYTDWKNADDPIKLREAALNVYNDGLFLCEMNVFADAFVRSGNKVYRYVYDFGEKDPSTRRGRTVASHGTDIIVVMGPAFVHFLASDEGFQNRMRMYEYFGNFVKTSNPNLHSEEFKNVTFWPEYKLKNKEYNLISGTSSIHKHYRVEHCALWNRLLPMRGFCN